MADKKIPLDNTAAVIEFIKSLVRPLTNLAFVGLIIVMVYQGRFEEIPVIILAAGGLLTAQNAWERGKKRMSEINGKGKAE